MDTAEPSFDWSLGDNKPHSARETRPCSECDEYRKDVFDRASFREKKLLCRECVEIVERERRQQKMQSIREGYNDGT